MLQGRTSAECGLEIRFVCKGMVDRSQSLAILLEIYEHATAPVPGNVAFGLEMNGTIETGNGFSVTFELHQRTGETAPQFRLVGRVVNAPIVATDRIFIAPQSKQHITAHF